MSTNQNQKQSVELHGVRHLSQCDLAARWHMSARTLERWRFLHQGPPFLKLGGRIAYRLADIEAFEAMQTRDAAGTDQPSRTGMPASVAA